MPACQLGLIQVRHAILLCIRHNDWTLLLAHIIRLLMLQKSISDLTISKYLMRLIIPGILIISTTTLIVYCVEGLHTNRILLLLLSFAVSAVSISILLYAVGISKKERSLIKELVNRKLKK